MWLFLDKIPLDASIWFLMALAQKKKITASQMFAINSKLEYIQILQSNLA